MQFGVPLVHRPAPLTGVRKSLDARLRPECYELTSQQPTLFSSHHSPDACTAVPRAGGTTSPTTAIWCRQLDSLAARRSAVGVLPERIHQLLVGYFDRGGIVSQRLR